jgi:hypothetical protein
MLQFISPLQEMYPKSHEFTQTILTRLLHRAQTRDTGWGFDRLASKFRPAELGSTYRQKFCPVSILTLGHRQQQRSSCIVKSWIANVEASSQRAAQSSKSTGPAVFVGSKD